MLKIVNPRLKSEEKNRRLNESLVHTVISRSKEPQGTNKYMELCHNQYG